MMEDMLNAMRREAERAQARATTWAVGSIDSYDKATHSAKVKLQPEGTLSGWLPLNAIGVGSGFGVHIGPKVGDPVLVHFHEGDREAGVILGRFFADKHPPVAVEEGEFLLRHESETQAYFKQDGSLIITQKNGSQIIVKADGQIGVKPADGKMLFVGGTGDDGHIYAFVQTVGGPSTNVKARID